MAEPFGKVYRSIFGSSIMEEDPVTRLVWSYLLAMGYPTGEVDHTAVSLARRFNLPLASVEASLAKLAGPDPTSRTPDEDGRRIVLLDVHRNWGWRIVNFEKYLARRDRQSYQADYYQKRKGAQKTVGGDTEGKIQPVDNVDSTSSTDSTHKIEIEIERENKKEAAPKPKRKARVNDLSYPAELLRIVPDFKELWLESRKVRRLGSKTSLSAELKQIDKLATWATKYGAKVVREEIDRANTAGWQGICFNEPKGLAASPKEPAPTSTWNPLN